MIKQAGKPYRSTRVAANLLVCRFKDGAKSLSRTRPFPLHRACQSKPLRHNRRCAVTEGHRVRLSSCAVRNVSGPPHLGGLDVKSSLLRWGKTSSVSVDRNLLYTLMASIVAGRSRYFELYARVGWWTPVWKVLQTAYTIPATATVNDPRAAGKHVSLRHDTMCNAWASPMAHLNAFIQVTCEPQAEAIRAAIPRGVQLCLGGPATASAFNSRLSRLT